MKTQSVRKGWNLIVGTTLLAGMLYAVVALNTNTAHAATCDCTEEIQLDATNFCLQNYGSKNLAGWECPLGINQEYQFKCQAQPGQPWHIMPCD